MPPPGHAGGLRPRCARSDLIHVDTQRLGGRSPHRSSAGGSTPRLDPGPTRRQRPRQAPTSRSCPGLAEWLRLHPSRSRRATPAWPTADDPERHERKEHRPVRVVCAEPARSSPPTASPSPPRPDRTTPRPAYRSKLWAKTLRCSRDSGAPSDPALPIPARRRGRGSAATTPPSRVPRPGCADIRNRSGERGPATLDGVHTSASPTAPHRRGDHGHWPARRPACSGRTASPRRSSRAGAPRGSLPHAGGRPPASATSSPTTLIASSVVVHAVRRRGEAGDQVAERDHPGAGEVVVARRPATGPGPGRAPAATSPTA